MSVRVLAKSWVLSTGSTLLALYIIFTLLGIFPSPLSFNVFGRTSAMSNQMSLGWFDLAAKQSDGSVLQFESLRGKVVLVVNVASRCGFTPQYKQLQELHDQYGTKGLTILAFPCNQFGGQEPGSDSDILQFCSTNYGVTFPVMSKIQVNGAQTDPIYEYLKSQAPGLLGSESIKWNFTKFLVDQNGKVLSRYAPTTSPSDIGKDIEKLLQAR
jgi:glutathione peroxidase